MHFPRRPAILSSRAAKPTPSWSAAVTSGAWPSGPHNVLPVPAIEKSPRIAVFKRFSGGFPVCLGHRRCATSSGLWAQKKTPTAVDAFALNENENVRAFPALIMPVPVDIRGFSSTSPASPGLSRFLNYPVPLHPDIKFQKNFQKIFCLLFSTPKRGKGPVILDRALPSF